MENHHVSEEGLEALKEKARQGGRPKQQSTEQCDRITATFSMVHESCGFDPIKAHAVFTELLKTKEQPYQRRMLIQRESITISPEWVKEPGYLIIENKKGGSTALIYVGVAGAGSLFEIAPGHIFAARLSSDALKQLRVWANEECPACITIMPS